MLSRQLNLPKRSNDMFAPTRHNRVLDIIESVFRLAAQHRSFKMRTLRLRR